MLLSSSIMNINKNKYKYKMAKKLMFALTDSTNTAGHEANAKEFYTQALLGDTRDKRSSRYFRQLLVVGEKTKLGKIVPDDVLHEADSDFVGSDVDLSQKTIEPTIFNIGVEISQWDVEQSFISEYTQNVGAIDFLNTTGLLPEFQSHLLHEVSRKVSENIEKLTWQGEESGSVGNYLDEMDGLIKKLDASSEVVKVPGTTITVSNIITELEKLVIAIPSQVDNVKVGMNAKMLRLYKLATAKANNRENMTHALPENVIDYEIVVMPGMPDDTFVAANFDENFYFATDLTRDADLTIIYMKSTTGDRKIRVIGDIKVDFGFLNDDEVSFYTA